METIEERAFQYIEKQCKGCRNEDKKGRYFGFVQGATEQKAIDDAEHTEEMRKLNEEWEENLVIQRAMLIEKACEWLLSQGIAFRCIVDDVAFVERFKKAMEE